MFLNPVVCFQNNLPRVNYSPFSLVGICLRMSLFLEESALRRTSPQGTLRSIPALGETEGADCYFVPLIATELLVGMNGILGVLGEDRAVVTIHMCA